MVVSLVAAVHSTLVWIKTVPEDKATGDLKRSYEAVLRARGKISNVMRAQSLNPNAMRSFLDMYVTLMFGKSSLSREERETIATLISAQNQCDYCVTHHREALRFYLKNDNQLDLIRAGQLPENLTARTKALIDYALKLNSQPNRIVKRDLDALRTFGVSDSEILDLVLLTGYMNFVNRIAQGLGVEHDEQEAREYKY
jgi:uncharacterized peroxidase-related enzyme